MQTILNLVMVGILLLLPGVSFAETGAECQTRCAAEKASRDDSCPEGGRDPETDQARDRCVQENQDAYNTCMNGCAQLESAEQPAE
jgi:hypothetical protein